MLRFLALQFYLFELLLEAWSKAVLLGAALRGFACFPAFTASRAADAACGTNWRLTGLINAPTNSTGQDNNLQAEQSESKPPPDSLRLEEQQRNYCKPRVCILLRTQDMTELAV